MSHRTACGWSQVRIDSGPVALCGPVALYLHSTRWSQISAEIAIFAYPPAFGAPLGNLRRKIAVPFGAVKPEWFGYPRVKKSPRIRLLVLTKFTNVIDGQTPHDGIDPILY